MSQYARYFSLSGSGSGVTSINGATGALNILPGTGITITTVGQNITISAINAGTVTSVGLADGSTTPIYAISGSPVTSAGTLTFTLNTQTAHTFFAGPSSGGAAQPTFRAIVASDLPAGTGTVTSVSVVSANGFAGTVATPTTTPAITLSTTITGILQGNGTAISAATTGNLTDAGTDGIVITGGTGAVLGSGTSIAQTASSASTNGYLSAANFVVFNSKQPAGNYITALTGDGTASGPGSAVFTLATVNSNVGSFTNANITVNAKGLITAASSGTSGTVTSVALTAPSIFTVSGSPITSSGTLALTYSGTALPVTNGGTGDTAFTANQVILGGTTSTGALQQVAGGTSGYVLTSTGATSAPTWQPSSGGGGGSVVTFKAMAVGTPAPGANNPIIFTSVYDTNSGFNGSTGQYTIPAGQGGYWRFGGTFQVTGSAPGNIYITQNGTSVNYISTPGASAIVGNVVSGWTEFDVSAGDVITWQDDSTDTFLSTSYYIATKISSGTTSLSIGALDSGVANSTGLYLTGTTLSTQSASSSSPGMVNNTSQTFSGSKNFTSPIGYNNTTPNSATSLDIINTTGATQRIVQTGYGGQVGLRGRYANGTLGSPTAATNGNILEFISGMGYGSSTFPTSSTGAINIVAGETFTNASNATYLQFSVTPTGSVTTAEAMRVNSTGNVLIGTTTDSGTQKLQVNGNSNVGTVTAGLWNGTATSGQSFLTTGTTYTTPAGITTATIFKFTLIGAGGGGGGNTAVASIRGAGGGAGGVNIVYVTGLSPSTGYTITIGTGGTGVSASTGNAGGSTSIIIGTTTYTAGGGSGGAVGPLANGGIGGTTTNATIPITGGQGGGVGATGTQDGAGFGGSNQYGPITPGATLSGAATVNGLNGNGYGSGGSGSSGGTTASAGIGGTGAPGAILAEWKN